MLIAAPRVRAAASAHQTLERPQDVQVPGLNIRLRAGWQLLFYDGCRFAVPAAWRRHPDNREVIGPDGSNVSVRRLFVRTWSERKSQIRAAFGPVTLVHEDGDRRLWLESSDEHWSRHYVAVNESDVVCGASFEIWSPLPNASETAGLIAASVGAAPDEWPPR